ncbi:MAG: ABC transporter ATP-binding protein [Bacteroidales bacterium]|nr:ABC transporter ATP-binding protein [Bacteroidales bacterium]
MSDLLTDNLSVGYYKANRSVPIISNISLSFGKSELVAILGANGIGKSTFLKTISGLLPPIDGQILLNENNLESYSNAEKAKELVYVPAGLNLYFDFVVWDFIAMARTPYLSWNAILKSEDKLEVQNAINLVGGKHLAQRKIFSLSDGERQKVVLAKALAQSTQIIFLDEPTAFLDIENKTEIFYLLRQLVNKEQKTILFSTHDWNMATQFADKLLIFNNNNYEFGTPEDLIERGKFDSIFSKDFVHFDYNNLHFKPKTLLANKLVIKNFSDTLRYKLSLNALQRASFDNNCNFLSTETVIEVRPDYWIINSGKYSQRANSFNELLFYLKSSK